MEPLITEEAKQESIVESVVESVLRESDRMDEKSEDHSDAQKTLNKSKIDGDNAAALEKQTEEVVAETTSGQPVEEKLESESVSIENSSNSMETEKPVQEVMEQPAMEVVDTPAEGPVPVANDVVSEILADPAEILDVSKTEAVLTSSLALIANYGISDGSGDESEDEESSSSSSSSSSSDSSDDEVQVVDTVSYRNTVNVISSGESGGDSDVEFVEGSAEGPKRRPKKIIKAKGELDIVDLPPIEDLNISVPEHECIELGTIMSVVDQLVLVESHPGNVALDLDTVLFLDNGKRALGRIFDVLGQVNQPIYCVRFNSAEQIQEKEILAGMKVFYNNQRPEHTSVVVLPNLLRYKGSDASWDHDIEPPEGCLEYSDDEAERSARKARKTGQKAIPEDPTQQRMKRVRQQTAPSSRPQMGRVRNPFAGPRFSNPPPPLPNTGGGGGYQQQQPQQQQQWNNQRHQNQWPTQNIPGYGSTPGNGDYGNYSWHTYYQQQQQFQQQPPPPQNNNMYSHPPPPTPQMMMSQNGPPPPSSGPFYVNPYAQHGPGTSAVNNAVQQGQQMRYNGNYYGGQGPSNGGQIKQERK